MVRQNHTIYSKKISHVQISLWDCEEEKQNGLGTSFDDTLGARGMKLDKCRREEERGRGEKGRVDQMAGRLGQ